MAPCLADLNQRDRARLTTELVEVIASRFAYPLFFDHHTEQVRLRPVSKARAQEIASFVQATSFAPIERTELGSPEVRRFFEQMLTAYTQANPDLARPAGRRRLALARAEIPRAAEEVQRGLVALASGAPGTFGHPRPVVSWDASGSRLARAQPKWDRVERDTQQIQDALFRGQEGAGDGARTGREGSAIGGARPATPSAWADAPMDDTSPLHALRVSTPGVGPSPFAGLASGSQSALFGDRPNLSMAEQPTGMQPIVGLGDGPAPGAPAELPPDLLQLYNEYLRDLPPRGPSPAPPPERAAPARGRFGWRAPGSPPPNAPPPGEPATAHQPATPAPQDNKRDALIFQQLRHQLDSYIRLAARSYGVRVRGPDPASALDALRRSGHVDETDLRIAESILALSDRIMAGSPATMDDYRQALMLYLLYHRSRMGS
jgi:hypothetical protein